jgi:PRMT5 arginine-N-methyltransferase
MDDLQGITYQTFEQDPVKYQKYEEVRCGDMIQRR